MRIAHNINNKRIEKEVAVNTGFLLTNKSGGFFSLGLDSKYSGFFCRLGGKVFKIIEDIKREGSLKCITNNVWNVERQRGGLTESFFMPLHTNALVYEVNKIAHVELLLDIREPYDDRQWGRNYEISIEKKNVVVKFTKQNDFRDGEQSDKAEYTIYLVIAGDENLQYENIAEWIKKEYELDKKRGSSFERYIYKAAKLSCKKIVFSAAYNKEEAIEIAEHTISDIDKLKEVKKRSQHKVKDVSDDEVKLALHCAVNSVDELLINERTNLGIYAGLPWFFQFWTRDEVISLKSLMLNDRFNIVRELLIKELKSAALDGRLPNRNPPAEIGSADSLGWHFKRWYDLIEVLSKKGLLDKYFDQKNLIRIINRLIISLKLESKEHTKEGFAINSSKETWMDSIDRYGITIEIQALRLSMYNILFDLTQLEIYNEMKNELKNKVREEFWDGNCLLDRIGDPVIRPNVFIAAYIYPDLLTEKEWETCFENILPKLWLNWGGLSTIDKYNEKFCDSYTGEDPRSYHTGDSWFWINNLAAIVLYRTNKIKFQKYIKKILTASTDEILWGGMIGHHAELSSAAELRSEGCFSQAWSSAMYIELINEIYFS